MCGIYIVKLRISNYYDDYVFSFFVVFTHTFAGVISDKLEALLTFTVEAGSSIHTYLSTSAIPHSTLVDATFVLWLIRPVTAVIFLVANLVKGNTGGAAVKLCLMVTPRADNSRAVPKCSSGAVKSYTHKKRRNKFSKNVKKKKRNLVLPFKDVYTQLNSLMAIILIIVITVVVGDDMLVVI